MQTRKATGLVTLIAVFVGMAACKGDEPQMDEALKQDLAAAVAPQPAHLQISPSELSPSAAPARVAPKRTPQPSHAPSVRRTPRQPETSPAPAQHAPVMTAPVEPVQQAQPAPAPAPEAAPPRAPRSEEPRHGPYKTEAEIFRQMPWIRP